MSDRIVTAEVRIDAADHTGAVFANLSKKIDSIGKAAKGSHNIDAMTKSLEKAQAQMRAIDTLQSKRGSFESARSKFRQTQVAVEQAANAMRRAEGPTKQLAATLDKARASVTSASAAFERQKSAVLDAKRALDGFGIPVGKLASEQERLRGVVAGTTREIEQQVLAERRAAQAHAAVEARSHGIAHHGIVNYALSGAAAFVGAHSVVSGIERSVEAGAEYRHEIIGLQNAGRTPEEIAAIERRSAQVVGRLPTAGYTENLKVIAETTPAFGSVEHAMDYLEFMQKSMSVLKAAGGEHIKGGVGDVGRALAKTFEERFTKAENFEKEAGAMIPAMVASGGVFNPEQLYAFAQQAKSSLPNYSMRFLSRIAPSLIGAQGGERAGTAANAFNSIIMGKVNDKKQAEAWEKFGLLDDTKVIKKAGNVVSWSAGAVKGTDLAMSDPLRWAEEIALPAMMAKGVPIEERKALAKELATMFRNQNGNMFANEIMQADSRARLHKDEALTNRVGSLNDIYHRNLGDFHVGLDAFKTSLDNLMTTVSGPLMGSAARGMSGLASNIDSFANMMQRHPEFAAGSGILAAGGALAGAGYASYKLMNGFGLGSSAIALDSSAAALHSAALALDGAAVKEGLGSLGGGAAGLGKALAIEGMTISVGTLAIAGVAAVAVIAALSQGKKPQAADDPNLGSVFGPKFQMPTTLGDRRPWWGKVLGEHDGGGGRGQLDANGRPYTIEVGRNGVRSKHYLTAPAPYKGVLPTFAAGWNTDDASLGWMNGHQGRRPVEIPMGHIGESPMDINGKGSRSLIGAAATTVDITGKVEAEIKGQAIVGINIKVDGPGTVTGQYSSSTGNIRVGTSMPGARTASNGRVAGPN